MSNLVDGMKHIIDDTNATIKDKHEWTLKAKQIKRPTSVLSYDDTMKLAPEDSDPNDQIVMATLTKSTSANIMQEVTYAFSLTNKLFAITDYNGDWDEENQNAIQNVFDTRLSELADKYDYEITVG